MGVAGADAALDHAGNHQERCPLLRGVGDAVDRVGKPWTQGRHQETRRAGYGGGTGGHDRGRRLVPGQDEADAALASASTRVTTSPPGMPKAWRTPAASEAARHADPRPASSALPRLPAGHDPGDCRYGPASENAGRARELADGARAATSPAVPSGPRREGSPDPPNWRPARSAARARPGRVPCRAPARSTCSTGIPAGPAARWWPAPARPGSRAARASGGRTIGPDRPAPGNAAGEAARNGSCRPMGPGRG